MITNWVGSLVSQSDSTVTFMLMASIGANATWKNSSGVLTLGQMSMSTPSSLNWKNTQNNLNNFGRGTQINEIIKGNTD